MLWILWILFIILQIVHHYYIIVVCKKSPNYIKHTLVRFIISYLLLLFFNSITILNFLILGTSFWFLFDIGLNVARGLPIDYVGKNAWLDRLSAKIDKALGKGAMFYLKLMLLILFIILTFK
jgi:hypothetical protein